MEKLGQFGPNYNNVIIFICLSYQEITKFDDATAICGQEYKKEKLTILSRWKKWLWSLNQTITSQLWASIRFPHRLRISNKLISGNYQ